MHLTCAWLIRGDVPPQPTFPFKTYSWDSELNSLATIYSSSDHPTFSAKAQGPIYNLSPHPYSNDMGVNMEDEELVKMFDLTLERRETILFFLIVVINWLT